MLGGSNERRNQAISRMSRSGGGAQNRHHAGIGERKKMASINGIRKSGAEMARESGNGEQNKASPVTRRVLHRPDTAWRLRHRLVAA